MSDFDAKRFISEIKSRPAIWNFESPDYSSKYAKQQAWEEVCGLLVRDYDTLEVEKKTEKCKNLQKKWRNLRDCFSREINAQKSKSGSVRSDRKQYIFFNHLSFLRQTIEKRKTQSNLDVGASQTSNKTTSNAIDFVDNDLTTAEDNPDNPVAEVVSQKTSESRITEKVDVRPPSRKRSNEQLMATKIQVLENISKRFGSNAGGTPQPQPSTNIFSEDQDRLFLMSLTDDLKKVHDSNKLEMKSELIMVIKRWQRTPPADYQFQQFHQNNPRTTIMGPLDSEPHDNFCWPEPSTAATAGQHYRPQQSSSNRCSAGATNSNRTSVHSPSLMS